MKKLGNEYLLLGGNLSIKLVETVFLRVSITVSKDLSKSQQIDVLERIKRYLTEIEKQLIQ